MAKDTKKKETKVSKEEKVKTTAKETTKEEDVQFYDKKHKSLGQKIWDVVFWTLICVLAFIWIFDFIKVQNNENPQFCIKNIQHTYSDGTVNECVGLGYKVYQYNRSNLNIKVQFSPFFIGMQTEEGD